MKLYELTGQFSQLYEMADSGEIDKQTFFDTLEAMDFETELEANAEYFVKLIRNLEGSVSACKAEEDQLAQKRKGIELNIRRMKDHMQAAMDTIGRDKIETPLFSLRVQNNPPSVTIADERLVPEKYLIPQPSKVDRKAILADAKAGATFDWATVTQGRSLRIR